jgi:hypothetical protein
MYNDNEKARNGTENIFEKSLFVPRLVVGKLWQHG